MGLFFLISAYFTETSLNRRGTRGFLSGRLLRLGVPMLLFFFIISPITGYFLVKNLRDPDVSFLTLFLEGDWFGIGPLWFVETLLIFTLIYLVYLKFGKRKQPEARDPRPLPRNMWIIVLAVAIGLASFLVRIHLPVGWSIPILSLQLPFFPQYIVMLILGIIAARRNWLEQVGWRKGIRWFLFAQVMVFAGFPLLFFLGGATSGSIEPFMGGLTWQSLAYSLWEQVTGISLMIGLIGIFREKFNSQGELGKNLSTSAYGVFVFHPPVIVLITLVFRPIEIPGIAKFLLLAPVTVAACFLVAFLIRKIPFADRVL